MTKFGKLIVTLIILFVVALMVYLAQKQPVLAPETVPEVKQVEDAALPLVSADTTNDLVSFSIKPDSKLHGQVSYNGVLKGGYFFEGNVLINILDANKKVIKASNAIALSDWMTSEAVDFKGTIDLTGLPSGKAFFEIHNDNASGLPENDKSILIPIIIE